MLCKIKIIEDQNVLNKCKCIGKYFLHNVRVLFVGIILYYIYFISTEKRADFKQKYNKNYHISIYVQKFLSQVWNNNTITM